VIRRIIRITLRRHPIEECWLLLKHALEVPGRVGRIRPLKPVKDLDLLLVCRKVNLNAIVVEMANTRVVPP
jgi:hypothetical protein